MTSRDVRGARGGGEPRRAASVTGGIGRHGAGLLPRLREAARTAGWARSLRAAPLWLVRPTYSVVRWAHGAEEPDPPVDLSGLELRRIDRDDADRVREVEPGIDRGELLRRLEDGLEGRLVLDRGEVVYARWDAWADHRLPYLRATFRLRPGDHHPALAFTRPERRGEGLHGRLLAWSLGEARRRGCRRSFGLVAAWNAPSARAVSKPGWRPVGTVGCWTLGPWTRHVASGAVRIGPGRSFEVVDEGPGPTGEASPGRL